MDKLTLKAALQQLQAHHIPIRLTPRSVELWSPGKRVPCLVRRCIKQHKAEVRAMILSSKIEVCPSPGLHRHSWRFPGQEWIAGSAICGVCEQLSYISEVKPSKANYEKIAVSEVAHVANGVK